MSKKIFDNYARLIVQFNKNQNVGNNYLYIDIVMKLKSGVSYPAKLQTYILCYGIKGLQSDIQSSLYDALWTVGNGKIIMNEVIDMGGKKIIGIQEDTENSGAVNFKQLYSYTYSLELKLNALIDKKQNDSYHYELFGRYFFDFLDPSMFTMTNPSGPIVFSIYTNLRLGYKGVHDLNNYDTKYGFYTGKGIVFYTIFSIRIMISQCSSFLNMILPNLMIIHYIPITWDFMKRVLSKLYILLILGYQKMFYIQKSKNERSDSSILSAYKNKQLMLWFAKNSDDYQLKLCDNGGYITETIITSSNSFRTNQLNVNLYLKTLRVGFSPNFYAVNGPEFHKILFMEKSRGTFFQ